jgi:glycine cleavage system aminomethyltransferase T
MTSGSPKNLQEVLDQQGDIVAFLRNQQTGPNVYPGVPAEFTNWRDEQWAWRHASVLYNQSYHMVDLLVEGPDAMKLLAYLGINTFNNFAVGRAKQFVPCTPAGHVIGDVILFHLAENSFNLVGRAPVIEWVEFNAATGGYNVTVERDERTALRTDGKRRSYRFQVQGPTASQVIEAVTGAPMPDVKFFHMTTVTIAGKTVQALRHGMAGQPGLELYGPWEDGEAVREAIVAAGKPFGLRQVGGRAYSSNTLDSGWIPSPLPAVFTGEALADYRRWLPATSYEAKCSIGGSFVSSNIEDYYLNPWDLGYGGLVKFDHDFVGRAALEKMAAGPKRHKVTLALHNEDVGRVIMSAFQPDNRAKYMEFPSSVYSMHPFDQILMDGKQIGLSTWIGYSSNDGQMLSLGIVDERVPIGAEVELVWGEENGGTSKPTVERHVQTKIRARVSAVPYAETARVAYTDGGWRERGVA